MENLFERVEKDLTITGWKVLDILNKDSFNLTIEEINEINRLISYNITLKTNEEYWITNFYVKVVNLEKSPLDNIILVSPECPEQYITFEELRNDILNPVKELIKNEYLSGETKIIKTTIEEYLRNQLGYVDSLRTSKINWDDYSSGYDNILTNSITSSTSQLDNDLLNKYYNCDVRNKI